MNKIDEYNNLLLNRLSIYLNDYSDAIDKEMVNNLVKSTNISEIEAYKYLLAANLGLDVENKDKELYNLYFNELVTELDPKKYNDNPYNKNIIIQDTNDKSWKFLYQIYKPYELFVYNDMVESEDGRIIPKLGYFKEEYKYLSVLENDREWMLITPNEIETMDDVIKNSKGNVLTYGLGLGYFPYMVSLKEDVCTITIVEKDKKVIELFNKYILPLFEYKDKITIINDDAFNHIKTNKDKYDVVFIDIWHDVSDGLPLYQEFKKYEKQDTKYYYWIEKTMNCYLKTNQD